MDNIKTANFKKMKDTYREMKDYIKAIQHHELALEMCKRLFSGDHLVTISLKCGKNKNWNSFPNYYYKENDWFLIVSFSTKVSTKTRPWPHCFRARPDQIKCINENVKPNINSSTLEKHRVIFCNFISIFENILNSFFT